MIEVLFGESEAASMKMAKGRRTVVGGAGKAENGSGTWIGGHPRRYRPSTGSFISPISNMKPRQSTCRCVEETALMVPGTSNLLNRLITQKPESVGSDRPMPPAQMARDTRIGDTVAIPAKIGAKIADVVTSATVVEPWAARSTWLITNCLSYTSRNGRGLAQHSGAALKGRAVHRADHKGTGSGCLLYTSRCV